MTSELLQYAIQGTVGKTIDFTSPTLARFSKVFSDPNVSKEKKLGLALGIEALVELTSPRHAPGDAKSSFAFEPIDRRDFVSREVAEAATTILDAYDDKALRFPTNRFSIHPSEETDERVEFHKIYPVASLLRAFKRRDLRVPPECCSHFTRRLRSQGFVQRNARLLASIAPPNARELAIVEVGYSRALELASLYLDENDALQGVTLDEIEAVIRDEANSLDDVVAATIALRRLAPERARAALGAVLDRLDGDSLTRGAELLACLKVGLGERDVPFLKGVFEKRASSALVARACELLVQSRDAELLDKLVAFADEHMTRKGVFESFASELDRWGLDYGAESDRELQDKRVENLFKRIPLEHWEEYFGAEPDAILDMLSKDDHFLEILAGLRGSRILFNGPQKWTAPLARLSLDWASDDDFATWLDETLSLTDPHDAVAIREIIDVVRTTATTVRQINQAQLATLLALYEPYPWRDEFAEYFDDALWRAFLVYDCRAERPQNPRKLPSRKDAAALARQHAKEFFEKISFSRLADDSDESSKRKIAVEVVPNGTSEFDANVDEIKSFVYLFAANVLPVLYLAPQKLRDKYFDYGQLLFRRFLRVVYEAFEYVDVLDRERIFRMCDGSLPFFLSMNLFDSSELKDAISILERDFLSRGREE